MKNIVLFLMSMWAVIGCSAPANHTSSNYGNAAAEGFNLADSDAKAIAMADEVMENMGGRAAWDQVETIEWTFFGRRQHLWNKQDNTVTIKVPADSTIIDLDMNDMSGSAVIDGNAVDADSLGYYLKRAEGWWINDSYWLVMPFKLKDSGVTLNYVGRDSTAAGQMGDKLSLTFEGVGRTPQNKYEVIVTDENRLIEEWRFYTNATDSIPRFTTPWQNYKKYGDILLADDRGRPAISDINVKMKSSSESE